MPDYHDSNKACLLELPHGILAGRQISYMARGLPHFISVAKEMTVLLSWSVLTNYSHACHFVFLSPVFFFQMTKSVTNPEELGGLASQMTNDYGHLALQGRMAAATAEPEEVCRFQTSLFSIHGGINMGIV